MRLSTLADARVALLGFGAEGRSTLAALRRERADADACALGDSVAADAAALGIESLAGEAAAERLTRVDVVVKSPGVKPSHPLLAAARERRLPITTATNLALAEIRAAGLQILCVTGSKGKSTTTSLAHLALENAGVDSALVGNIGAPALDALPGILARRAVTCFEISSYQCHDLDAGPDVAVILNLFPEHMDWHGSVEAYYAAKCRLAALQSSGGLTVHDADDAEIARRLPLGPARHVAFGRAPAARFEHGAFWRGADRLFDDAGMRLRGLHNRRNACAAMEAALPFGASPEHVRAALQSFTGLPHRLDEVPGSQGIRWIDDSISTAPEAAVAALEAFRGSVSTLIAGGHDRGYDFTPLIDALLADAVPTVICLPPSGLRLAKDLRERAGSSGPRVLEAADLAGAVTLAREATPPGRVCLFSPASPSYGAFRDFKERGQAFRRLVADGSA